MYCWSGLASGNRYCITLERTTGLVLLEEKDGVSESSIDWLNLGQLFNFSNPHHKGLSWEWPTLNHKTKYYETISFQSSHQRSVSILQITWSQAKKWVITHIFWERALTWAHQRCHPPIMVNSLCSECKKMSSHCFEGSVGFPWKLNLVLSKLSTTDWLK